MNKYLKFSIYAIIAVSAIIFIISCTPKKVITQSKSDVKTEIKSAITDTKTSEKKQDKTIVDQSATDTETTVKITTYDNDKPIDLTGKHPIKEEKVITTKKVKKSDIKTDLNTNNNQVITHSDNSKTNIDSNTEVKTKEIPKAPAVKYYLYLAVLLIGSFLTWKYFGKIKLLFAFLFKK